MRDRRDVLIVTFLHAASLFAGTTDLEATVSEHLKEEPRLVLNRLEDSHVGTSVKRNGASRGVAIVTREQMRW